MKDKTVQHGGVPQTGSDAALQLLQALQYLVDSSMRNCLENMPEQIIQLAHQMHQIETKQQQALYDFESVKKQLGNLASVNKLLENASETNHLLGKQHYDEHVIQPMLRSLFPVFDLIEDARRHRSISEQVADFSKAVWSQLEQFLKIYDVDLIRHRPKDRFDPQIMKPIRWIPVENSRLDGRVAESLQIGFRLSKERILRLETVALFGHQPSQKNMVTLNERKEQC